MSSGSGTDFTSPFTSNGVVVKGPALEKLSQITPYSGFYTDVGVNFKSFAGEAGATFISGHLHTVKPVTTVVVKTALEISQSLM